MMAEFEGTHPDEGTIHAWLDDALDAAESERVEAHVAQCASCAERVAEARGLIAGASRVVGLLDETPRPLLRPAVSPTKGTDLSAWGVLKSSPVRAAIAAAMLVAVGLTVTRDRVAVESSSAPTSATSTSALRERDVVATTPVAAEPPSAQSDNILESAVAKRVAQDQPPRGIGPTPGIAVPQAPPAPAANIPTLNSAPARAMAAGKAAAQFDAMVATGATADKSATRTEIAAVAGSGCYRITSPDSSNARWGGLVLPAEISLSSAGALVTGGATRRVVNAVADGGQLGTWTRNDAGELSLRLMGASAVTMAELSPDKRQFAGTLSAAPQLSEIVVTGAAQPAESRVARIRADSSPVAAQRAAAPEAKPAPLARTIRVVATRIDCPK